MWGGGGLSGYIRRWRATDNALESVALAHCDTLLPLDELAEIDTGAAGKAAYMLANGAGKLRAGRSGAARPAPEWRILFLSSGEIKLADKVAEDPRRRITAGQEVRVLDLQADAGKGLGVFEELHGFNRPSGLVDHLKAASARHYGHASREFLQRILRDPDGYRDKLQAAVDAWMKKHCPPEAEGQVRRAARRFALVAAAGELATEFGITGWPEGEASAAAGDCFRNWLDQRGGTEPAEVLRGIEQVRAFIDRHGASRFEHWGFAGQNVRDRAGYRREEPGGLNTFLFFTSAFREACGGIDPTIVAGALADRQMLEPGRDELAKVVRIPAANTSSTATKNVQRFYVVTPKLMLEEDA